MNPIPTQPIAPARIEYPKVQNFRALRSVEFKNLTPLTVLLGPNGSGKSTVFDVFAFLAECLEVGLRKLEVVRTIAAHINPDCNRSPSFVKFRDALVEATA